MKKKKKNRILLLSFIGLATVYLFFRKRGSSSESPTRGILDFLNLSGKTHKRPIRYNLPPQVISGIKKQLNSGLSSKAIPAKAFPYVWAMAHLESNDFKSEAFKNEVNPFGMGVARIRPHTRKGTSSPRTYDGGRTLSSYHTPYQAAQDLANWFNYFDLPWNAIDTPKDFVYAIKNHGYFGNAKKGTAAWKAERNRYLLAFTQAYNAL